jgi:cytidylate kinase
MIIAIDGPTASGKGTIARALAAHFGLPHLDTGLLYRAVGRQVFLAGGNPDDPEQALAATAFPDSLLEDPELRSEETGGWPAASRSTPPCARPCSNASRPLPTSRAAPFLTGATSPRSSPPCPGQALRDRERRRARAAPLGRDAGPGPHRQPRGDRSRPRRPRRTRRQPRPGPLRQAPDAALLDTSAMGREVAIAAAIALVEKQLASR